MLNVLTHKIEIVTKKKTLASKVTRKTRLKRKKTLTNEGRIYMPMKIVTYLMRDDDQMELPFVGLESQNDVIDNENRNSKNKIQMRTKCRSES